MGMTTLKGKTEKTKEFSDKVSGKDLLADPDVQAIKERENDIIFVVEPDKTFRQVQPEGTYDVPDGSTVRRASANDRAGAAD